MFSAANPPQTRLNIDFAVKSPHLRAVRCARREGVLAPRLAPVSSGDDAGSSANPATSATQTRAGGGPK
jgi:hypothetical protein